MIAIIESLDQIDRKKKRESKNDKQVRGTASKVRAIDPQPLLLLTEEQPYTISTTTCYTIVRRTTLMAINQSRFTTGTRRIYLHRYFDEILFPLTFPQT